MKRAWAVALALGLAAPAAALADDVSGLWHVAGKVDTFAFTLNCDFQQAGDKLTGVCQDASTSDPKLKTGDKHPLTAGSVMGDAVSWTYQSHFLLVKFDVGFAGIRKGDKMTGQISAHDHTGAFTATREAVAK